MSPRRQSFRDMLEEAEDRNVGMDMSYLEGRREGFTPSYELPAPAETVALTTPEVADSLEVAESTGQAAEASAAALEPTVTDPSPELRHELDESAKAAADASSAGTRGGGGGGANSGNSATSTAGGAVAPAAPTTPPVTTGQAVTPAEAELLEDAAEAREDEAEATAAERVDSIREHEGQERRDDISAGRKTDFRDDIQAQTAARGGSDAGSGTLPDSGFRIAGPGGQLQVRNLPQPITDVLRTQIRVAAVRERGVSDATAAAFSRRLSQNALVSAFLLSQLDVRLDVDPSTQVAIELFQSEDPLMGTVVTRLEELERRTAEQVASLGRLNGTLAQVQETGEVVEQMQAYAIADRAANFLRGSQDIHHAPIGHADAIHVRDKARVETKKRRTIERERDGRPIR